VTVRAALRTTLLAGLTGVGALASASGASAHEVRPAYLEIRELGAERYALLWKVPARGEMRLSLSVALPERCVADGAPLRGDTGSAFTDRWRVRCAGGLAGQTIAIAGLEGTLTDALARFERADGSSQVERLTPAAPAFVVAAAPSALETALTYLRLGVEHIALGIDHLLFVLGLVLLVPDRRRLVLTITAFTVAHSITLAAATLGAARLAPAPVEAVIALSIVFVAGEILHARAGRAGIARRWPWVVAFAFGLLHGFGFAGALREVGLPQQAIPLALLCFNVGVELGQLAFVALVLAAAQFARPRARSLPEWAERAPAYAIGAVAAFWTIQRVAAFWE
jgi:hypothetical protein